MKQPRPPVTGYWPKSPTGRRCHSSLRCSVARHAGLWLFMVLSLASTFARAQLSLRARVSETTGVLSDMAQADGFVAISRSAGLSFLGMRSLHHLNHAFSSFLNIRSSVTRAPSENRLSLLQGGDVQFVSLVSDERLEWDISDRRRASQGVLFNVFLPYSDVEGGQSRSFVLDNDLLLRRRWAFDALGLRPRASYVVNTATTQAPSARYLIVSSVAEWDLETASAEADRGGVKSWRG